MPLTQAAESRRKSCGWASKCHKREFCEALETPGTTSSAQLDVGALVHRQSISLRPRLEKGSARTHLARTFLRVHLRIFGHVALHHRNRLSKALLMHPKSRCKTSVSKRMVSNASQRGSAGVVQVFSAAIWGRKGFVMDSATRGTAQKTTEDVTGRRLQTKRARFWQSL